MIIKTEKDKFSPAEITNLVTDFLSSAEYAQLKEYRAYYMQNNPALKKQVQSKRERKKTPANYVPTPYYATVVNTMAGYMFQNVQYESDNQAYIDALTPILDANGQPVKDMQTGTYSLAFSRGVELVYSEGDKADIKFTSFDPTEWLIIYNDLIEPTVWCGIQIQASLSADYDYTLSVWYKNLYEQYNLKTSTDQKSGDITLLSTRPLYFDECPVISYDAEIIGEQSPFHCVISYIKALDALITGNSDEIERLTDALLILSQTLEKKDLDQITELKAIMNVKAEDRAEYIQKDTSPAFREYVSKFLVNEIHKHSHVIDWYSPDSGLSGQVSAKALKTRLFDMDMYSKRIELIYLKGAQKRIRLLNKLMTAKSLPVGDITIIYNRTVPSDFEDKLQAFVNVDYISKRTKWEKLGLDADLEEERLNEEKTAAMDLFQMTPLAQAGQQNDGDQDNENTI